MCSKSWCETAVSFRDRSQTGKDVVKEEEGGGVFFSTVGEPPLFSWNCTATRRRFSFDLNKRHIVNATNYNN
jgi:hypothetical protein